MNRRVLRHLVLALVAAQLLCAPPAIRAWAALASPAGNGSLCVERMPAPSADGDCPCCPDGDRSVAACLSSCTASVGAVPAFHVNVARATAPCVPAVPPYHLTALADPPLKPPPIG